MKKKASKKAYRDAYRLIGLTDEWCAVCDTEVIIPNNRRSRCPECGVEILPCSMCKECTNPCKYDSK